MSSGKLDAAQEMFASGLANTKRAARLLSPPQYFKFE
jgi:hypothetical protein